MLEGHGSDILSYKYKIEADFSSNVWYEGIPKGLSGFLNKKIQDIIHYPSPDAKELAKKIADLHGLSINNVLISNGATEAFYLIAQCYSNCNSNVVYPAFSEYEDACSKFYHNINFISNKEFDLLNIFPEKSIVWFGNPNNPDGKTISKERIETICKKNVETIFVVDEAYVELSGNCESIIGSLDNFKNLIIVRSLTKSFAIPGIRLGYVVASNSIIDNLKHFKMPWSVNSLAIESGLFIVDNYDNLSPNKGIVAKESRNMQKELAKIENLNVTPSDCNFFLVKINDGKATDLKIFLLKNYGLLIRDASNFRGLDQSYFRISLQKPSINNTLIEAINKWFEKL